MGWLPPWCPNLSLKVSAPKACPMIWWPMQMPKVGTLATNKKSVRGELDEGIHNHNQI